MFSQRNSRVPKLSALDPSSCALCSLKETAVMLVLREGSGGRNQGLVAFFPFERSLEISLSIFTIEAT